MERLLPFNAFELRYVCITGKQRCGASSSQECSASKIAGCSSFRLRIQHMLYVSGYETVLDSDFKEHYVSSNVFYESIAIQIKEKHNHGNCNFN
jgi:hypothetical protein